MIKPEHPCGFTPDMLEYMRAENSLEPGIDEFSPSRLLGCHRQAVLQSSGDWYTDIYNAYPMERGSMSHKLFEDSPPIPGLVGVVREIQPRLVTQIETKFGMKDFSGKPDLIMLHQVIQRAGRRPRYLAEIVDYKSNSEIKHTDTAAKPAHVLQVNMYRLLVARSLATHMNLDADIDVTTLTIQYLDMKKPRRFTSAQALTTRGKLIRSERSYESIELEAVKVYDYEEIEEIVVDLIERRIEAETTLPLPYTNSDEEDRTWMCMKCPLKAACYEVADQMGHAHSW